MSTAAATAGALARRRRAFGFRLALPALLVLLLLLAVPTVLTLIYSVHDVPPNGNGFGPFVGFRNYAVIFASPVFWRSVQVTVVFSIGFVVLSTVIGLAMAVLLAQDFIGRGLARALLIIPWATPWLVIGILWKWFADGSVGGLNAVLTQLHLIPAYQEFLSDPFWALPIVMIAAVWRQASFAGMLLLAGLQTLPGELGEAAAIDGANVWQRFIHIVLPWLRPVLITVTVLNVIYAFLQFDIIFAMTQGGPGDATQTISILIYRQLFGVTHIGLGSALAVLLGLLALVGGLLVVRLLYRPQAEAAA